MSGEPTQGSAGLDPENPWPGLEAYDEASREFFSGRAAEADELLRRVLDEPVTVLFGKSGLGKSSLLRAGVFPRLREKGYLPTLVRLQVRPEAERLIDQVRIALIETLEALEVEHPASPIGESLWEYLHRSGLELWTKQNRLARPVFVFDQFEELFTLGRAIPGEVNAFREDLADLAENRIPASLALALEDRSLAQRELDLEAMPYKVVLSLREDYLADLEGWRTVMPSLRRNRMRLLPMGPEQAFQAVHNARTAHVMTEALAHRIVAFLAAGDATVPEGADDAGRTVEPALLSLFCRGLNEQRKAARETCITEAMVEGGKESIVSDFYRESLEPFPPRARQFVEDQLITEHGFRNSYSVEDALAYGFVTAQELERLVDGRLLRLEHHLGTDRVELTHDLLTKAVLEERDRRRMIEQEAKELRQRRRMHLVVGLSIGLVVVFLGLAIGAGVAWTGAKKALAGEAEAKRAVEAEKKKVVELAQATKDQLDALQKTYGELSIAQKGRAEALSSAEKSAVKATEQATLRETEQKRAKSKELAAHAETATNNDPRLAMLLALDGIKLVDTLDARTALLDASRFAWPVSTLDKQQMRGEAKGVALSPGGDNLAVYAEGGVITVWDIRRQPPVQTWAVARPVADVTFVAFSPDGQALAVARESSLDLFDAKTGNAVRSLAQSGVYGLRIVFSPDGQWLASLQQDETVRVWSRRTGHPLAEPAPAKDVLDIALLPDAKAIIGVGRAVDGAGRFGLFARRFDQGADGKWVPTDVDLGGCVRAHSVSPTIEHLSATTRASVCIYRTSNLAATPARNESDIGAIDDIVWSAGGKSFAQFLLSEEVVVAAGTPERPLRTSIMKGGVRYNLDNNTMQFSVSEDGGRIAMIDGGGSVQIHALANDKPFMSNLDEGTVAVAPDGRWIAMTRLPAPVVEVVRVDAIGREAPVRIPLAKAPEKLLAAKEGLIVMLPGERYQAPSANVFDPATGRLRFPPRGGEVSIIGPAAELLIVGPPVDSKGPPEIVRVSDGAAVTGWQEAGDAQGPPELFLLDPRGMVGVWRRQSGDQARADLSVFEASGTRLVYRGKIIDLPAASRRKVAMADDGHAILEQRTSGGPRLEWPISTSAPTRAGDASRARSVAAAPDAPIARKLVSPRGRYEIRKLQDERGKAGQFEVLTRPHGSLVRTLAGTEHRFSPDDRWLAVWNDPKASGVRLLDLATGETATTFTDVGFIDEVEFEAGGAIARVRHGKGTTLVPLERRLQESFAKRLVGGRTLTDDERCTYGLRPTAECRSQVAGARSPGAQQKTPAKPAQEGANPGPARAFTGPAS